MTVFLVIGAVGVVLLLLSLLVGDVVEGLGGIEMPGGGLFSTASLAGFIGTLGFVGAILEETTGSRPVAIAGGLVTGLAIGALVGWATHQLRDHGEGSAPSTGSWVGREAVVVSEVPEAGYGRVRLQGAGGHAMNARADRALPRGTRVWVREVLSATAVAVEPIDALPRPDDAPPSES